MRSWAVDGDYRDAATFTALRKALGDARRPAHYLATPPSLFATVIEGLQGAGLTQDARVIVEKPFGRDLASARELNKVVRSAFPESAIFRIDHFLGREEIRGHKPITDCLADACWRWAHPGPDAGSTLRPSLRALGPWSP